MKQIAIFLLCIACVSCSQTDTRRLSAVVDPHPDSLEELLDKKQTDYNIETFFSTTGMNLVSELRYGYFLDAKEIQILALGGDGAHFLSPTGKENKRVQYKAQERPWLIQSVSLNQGENIVFLGTLPRMRKAQVFDSKGEILLDLPGAYYRPALSGDVLGDSSIEIIVVLNDTLVLYDFEGKQLKKIPVKNISPFVYLADVGGDGKKEIVARRNNWGGKGSVVTLKGNGDILHEWTPDFNFYAFSIIKWGDANKDHLLFVVDSNFVVTTIKGQVVAKLTAPLLSNDTIVNANGVWLYNHNKQYRFVCVGSTRVKGAHVVCVYSADLKLIYKNKVRESFSSLMALPPSDSNEEKPMFLIGGRNIIWKYSE